MRITYFNSPYYVFSIPINSIGKKLIITTENNKIAMTIVKNEKLKNENIKYSVFNYKNQPLFYVEKNKQNQLGNRVVFDNQNGYFKTKYFFEKTKFGLLNQKTRDSQCLGTGSFNKCMNCFFSECAASWVCVATLAVQPEATIAFALGVCAIDTVANNT